MQKLNLPLTASFWSGRLVGRSSQSEARSSQSDVRSLKSEGWKSRIKVNPNPSISPHIEHWSSSTFCTNVIY